MRAVAVRGRWVWGLSGLVTAAVLAVPGVRLITAAGGPWPVHSQPKLDTMVRTVTVPQPVTSLNLQSYGSPAQVASGPVSRVQVTETINYSKQDGGPPAVLQSVSGGHLTLADPVCNSSDCAVSFAVTVPSGVRVTLATDGGPAAVSGTAGAQVDSGGGPVAATGIDGPFTATTDGGSLQVNGLSGPLRVDTGGGPLLGQDIAAATATASTGGGSARIGFSAAPDSVLVSTDGGPAMLTVPGGPYALTAGSDGGPQAVGIATDPAARRSITVTSGGGSLQIEPPAARLPVRPAALGWPQDRDGCGEPSCVPVATYA